MTNLDIARRAGLAKSSVCRISQMYSWEKVPVETVDKFADGCGINILAFEKERKFLRRAKKAYLDATTPAQKKMVARLLRYLQTFAGRAPATSRC